MSEKKIDFCELRKLVYEITDLNESAIAILEIANLTTIECRDEVHGKNQIILTIYRTAQNRYTYSIQLKVGRIIRSIFPHQLDTNYDSPLQAKHAAFYTMLSWTKNSRSAKKSLFDFELMNVDQQSLFDDSDLLQPVPASS